MTRPFACPAHRRASIAPAFLAWTSLSLAGCKADQSFAELKRQLSTSLATFDAGIVPVNGRETLPIFLASTGSGDVTIFDVYIDDPDHWDITDSWMVDGGIVPGGSPDSPGYGRVDVVFKPDAEDLFRTTLTIVSDDSEVTERDEEGRALWRVALRGIGRNPCGQLYPTSHDFGPRPPGGYFSTTLQVENCGRLTLTIADFDITGSSSFSVQSPTPLYVLPGSSDTIEVAFEPAGGSPPASATVTMDSDAPALVATPIQLMGNTCEGSGHPGWDADNDGWTVCGGDCNDTDAAVHPGAVERPDNDIDDNCNGEEGEAAASAADDQDLDGITIGDGDCLDTDSTIYPGAPEIPNQIDDDCDGFIDESTELYDDDGDGFAEVDGDCDDSNVLVAPGTDETQNGIDDDCDGVIDEGSYVFDDDGDGVAEIEGGIDADCNDDDPWTYPDAVEDCDGVDNDCDGLVDEGSDDTPGAACEFLVERQEADAQVADAEKDGCSTLSTKHTLWVWLAAFGLIWTRRRFAP